ncbi:MAG: DUF2059 domain-containing protein [Myxococcota bacterium]
MKRYLFFFAISLSVTFLFSAGINVGANKPDSQKISDIRRLLELTGSGNLGMQVMKNMINSYKQMMPDVPQSFWDSFIQEVNADSLVELIIPIYDKYLSHEEVKDIIKFYESPSGKKLIKVLPSITEESMEAGRNWGKEISNKLIKRLQDEAERNNTK